MIISLRETADRLMAANSLILTAHVNPDGDAIGSCLGLKYILETLGKKVQVIIDDDLPKFLSIMPGIDQIQKPEADNYEAVPTTIWPITCTLMRTVRLRQKSFIDWPRPSV